MLLTCCGVCYIGQCLWRPVTQGVPQRRDGRYMFRAVSDNQTSEAPATEISPAAR